MPSGYTACIGEGASFQEFVLQCARAMGACIMQRDVPLDAEMLLEEVSDYHSKSLDRYFEELERLKRMTTLQIEEEHQQHLKQRRKEAETARRERKELREKYEAMLEQVLRWEPPTEEHVNFRRFMAEQIQESIKWDCSTDHLDRQEKAEDAKEWYLAKLESVASSIEYHIKGIAEESRRVKERNQWKIELYRSLGLPEPKEKA